MAVEQRDAVIAERHMQTADTDDEKFDMLDIASHKAKAEILLAHPVNPEAMACMKRVTTARIGVGRAGPRLNTRTLLTLRADHARARDTVMMEVDQAVLDRMGLFSIQTQVHNKAEYLTRPDLGRRLSQEAVRTINERCTPKPEVQIFAADGLSSLAINSNLERILPILTDGLTSSGINLGTPFFVKYGRVATEDMVSEALGAQVVCVLIGERPGLSSAEGMSAYIAYNAWVGMPESRRTVVSNIHKDGFNAVEAGAYIVELIQKMLKIKASGLDQY
jgi:ethanolamine ammonia-lyase small subunit